MSEHYCTYKDGMCELDIDEAYQQGRADGYSQAEKDYHTQTEKDRQSSYDCGYEQGKADQKKEDNEFFNFDKVVEIEKSKSYQQGKADALDIEMDKPMHFTPEQKAWIKKYISINGERQRLDGVREFAEWLPQHFDLRFSSNSDVWLDEFFNHTREEALVKWQKGEENE